MDFCNSFSVTHVQNFTVSSDNFTGATPASKRPIKHAVAYLKVLSNVPYVVPQCFADTFTVFCFNIELSAFSIALIRETTNSETQFDSSTGNLVSITPLSFKHSFKTELFLSQTPLLKGVYAAVVIDLKFNFSQKSRSKSLLNSPPLSVKMDAFGGPKTVTQFL